MAGIRDIKRKIVSVQNTQKITKAMKMVSAAKMRRAHEAMLATQPYAEKIKNIVLDLSKNADEVTHPFMKPSEKVDSIALVIVNSDRGLCGAFNSNVVRLATKFISEHPDKEIKLFIIGKNAYDFFKKRPYPILEKWVGFGGKASFDFAKGMMKQISDGYIKDEYQEVHLIFNEFRSTAYQVPKAQKLLPFAVEEDAKESGNDDELKQQFLFEPAPAILLERLVAQYLDFTMYHILLESAAGEHGARMVAMDNATRSADDMVKKLKLNYNKARQAAITTDLLDIINGAEALK